jgi:secretion/DNA translocation related CpaE-like protein
MPLVLMVVADAELAAGTERIAAAVGARTVRALTPGRRSWLRAAAIVVDEPCALRLAEADLPRRDGVVLVGSDEPTPASWSAAIAVGAQHVCVLPVQETDLVRHLAGAMESGPSASGGGPVLAVVPGRGGGGASVFTAALGASADEALLVDLDPCGGGLDLLLGAESSAGPRWPELRLHSGRLSWVALRETLPRRGGMSILSGTRSFHEVDAGGVAEVVDAGRRGGVTVVCDIPRQLTPAAICALQLADLVVVVTTCDIRGVAATTATLAALRGINTAAGLVVRGPSPGGLLAREVAEATETPLLAAMRPEPMLAQRLEQGGLRLRRRSPLSRAAATVLDVVRRNTERAA